MNFNRIYLQFFKWNFMIYFDFSSSQRQMEKGTVNTNIYVHSILLQLVFISYKVADKRHKRVVKLWTPSIEVPGETSHASIEALPQNFFKDNVSSSCADNIWRNHIHMYIHRVKYIVISSFSTWPLFGCASDLFFASIMQANPVSLPPVAPIPPPVAAFQMQMCWNVLNVP